MTRSTLLRGTVCTLLLSAFSCMHALAEPVPRSINEIISLALKQNAELSALEKEAAAKQSLAIQVGTTSNPTLEFQGITGGLTGSPEERSVSIGVNQELSLNGKLRMRREALQYEAEVVQRQRDNAARLLKDEVGTVALEFLLVSKRKELAADLVKLNRDLVTITGERFKAGDIPELELNLARVELARAESRMLEVERERGPLRIKIASLTALDENDINLSDMSSVPVPASNSRDLVKQALIFRPDLQALVRDYDKAETETRLADAEALPNLTAGFFVQWQRGSTEVGGMSSTSSDTQLGLRVSMPIPVFDRNRGGRAASQSRLAAAGSRRLALERTITAEVESSLSRLSSAERIAGVFEQGIIPQLNENLKLTQEAYRLGEVGILSVIDEQKKFFEINDSYLSAQHNRRMAFIKLESAVSKDLTGGAK
ncbi:MAG: TolC family protein [Geobacteraceae bacterium]|nr:TolC family protein [Geobacteraceae bacterium]NTW79192.1 TolC family protein [Geobacteraceae bacterium]